MWHGGKQRKGWEWPSEAQDSGGECRVTKSWSSIQKLRLYVVQMTSKCGIKVWPRGVWSFGGHIKSSAIDNMLGRQSRSARLQCRASGSTYGTMFRVTTFGESHGKGVGCIVDGVPPRLEISESEIQVEMDRRKPGQSIITTPRKEEDIAEILSGVFNGVTLGSPIAVVVRGRSLTHLACPSRLTHLACRRSAPRTSAAATTVKCRWPIGHRTLTLPTTSNMASELWQAGADPLLGRQLAALRQEPLPRSF